VHDAPFCEGGAWIDRLDGTIVVNPGRQLGALPAIIELDLDSGKLAWTSLAGTVEATMSAYTKPAKY